MKKTRVIATKGLPRSYKEYIEGVASSRRGRSNLNRGQAIFPACPLLKLRISLSAFGLLAMTVIMFNSFAAGSEILPETGTAVIVREHPRTGKPYVVITDRKDSPDPFAVIRAAKPVSRPDYRMLDPKIKSGQIPYDGPVSDRKKVYILAGTLAALGTAGGAAIIAAAPAATGAGAAGGAGAYAGAGAGVAAGTFAGTRAALKPRPEDQNFEHTSRSQEIEPK